MPKSLPAVGRQMSNKCQKVKKSFDIGTLDLTFILWEEKWNLSSNVQNVIMGSPIDW
jgi:hypothetical protein